MIPTFWKHIPHVRQWMHWKPSPITVSLLPRSNTTVARTYKFAGRGKQVFQFSILSGYGAMVTTCRSPDLEEGSTYISMFLASQFTASVPTRNFRGRSQHC